MESRYLAIQVTDMLTRAVSWKIFERGRQTSQPPVASGIATRALAEARIKELDAALAERLGVKSESQP